MAEMTLDLLGHLVNKVLDEQREMREDVRELKRRMTSLEMGVSQIHGDFSSQSMRIDRLETRLDRIARRLEIGDA